MRSEATFEKAKAMSAANLTTVVDSELEIVERWRHEALQRAGYDRESATVLAASHDVDLHRAIELLQRGCPANLALQILL
jgi:hypothetical protein